MIPDYNQIISRSHINESTSHNSFVVIDRSCNLVYKSYRSIDQNSTFVPNVHQVSDKLLQYQFLNLLSIPSPHTAGLSVDGTILAYEYIEGSTLSARMDLNIGVDYFNDVLEFLNQAHKNLDKFNPSSIQFKCASDLETADPISNFFHLTSKRGFVKYTKLSSENKIRFAQIVDQVNILISETISSHIKNVLILGDFKPDNIIVSDRESTLHFIDPLFGFGTKFSDIGKYISRLIIECNAPINIIERLENLYNESELKTIKHTILADAANFVSLLLYRKQLKDGDSCSNINNVNLDYYFKSLETMIQLYA